jgi:predicted enzyme related to lactoylglutathione lyase
MATHIDCMTFDCADPVRLAGFWAAALDYEVRDDEDGWIVLRSTTGTGPLLGFQRVPEPKVVKNRVHLDLMASQSMEDEVARLQQIGATVVRLVAENPEGIHTIMQDPEGNEFCVVQP